jgi:hypothetical protein
MVAPMFDQWYVDPLECQHDVPDLSSQIEPLFSSHQSIAVSIVV